MRDAPGVSAIGLQRDTPVAVSNYPGYIAICESRGGKTCRLAGIEGGGNAGWDAPLQR